MSLLGDPAAERVLRPDPCAFSPGPRQARKLARFYAEMFPVGSTVIDLGFGQAHFLAAARARGLLPIGLDRDQALVERAHSAGFDARCGDIGELEALVPESLDGGVAAHLIEHLAPEEVRALLRSLAGKIAPGGHLVLATPNFADWRVARELFWLDPTHVRPYPRGAVRQLLDPCQWLLEDEGVEPQPITRHTPGLVVGRLRYGRDYGRPGVWFRLRRL